jgi:hypothetical protein
MASGRVMPAAIPGVGPAQYPPPVKGTFTPRSLRHVSVGAKASLKSVE